MAELGKVLAQKVLTVESTSEQIYLAPTGQLSKVETIVVCNRDSAAHTFDISVDKTGDNPGSPEAKDYLYFNAAIPAYTSIVITAVLRLEGGDRMEGASNSLLVVFNVYGTEY